MVDKIFKLGLLILGAAFLFLYSQDMQKGRYLMETQRVVLDTETGRVYEKTWTGSSYVWVRNDPFGITK